VRFGEIAIANDEMYKEAIGILKDLGIRVEDLNGSYNASDNESEDDDQLYQHF
jgi:transposase